LVARAIHEQSIRKQHALVPVSSVALAPGLLTSELFGHEAGSFTGADKRRIGRFEKAHNGTLFLDEIGEMPIESQSILLRVLQERVIERVGGTAIPVDVRIISATNRNLEAEVHAGRFRQDLYFRLNVFPIALPPLRERASDIEELATHFVRAYSGKYSRSVRTISPTTMKQLSSHDWPGNIRELQNIIERAVIVSEGEIMAFDPGWLVGTSVVDSPKTWAVQERQRILDALQASNGRVYGPGGAAHRLGLNPTTLYGKMKKHGIARAGAD